MEIKAYLNKQRILVEEAFDSYFPAASGDFSDHITAMQYSLKAGGKEARTVLKTVFMTHASFLKVA